MSGISTPKSGATDMIDDTRPNPTFKERMDKRLARWYKGEDPLPNPDAQKRRKFLASLVNKSVMTEYIKGLNLPLPETLQKASTLEEINYESLPEKVVIKPSNGADSKGVIILFGGRNLMNGDEVSVGERREYIRDVWMRDGVLDKPGGKVIVEEFLQDYDSSYVIPRDFKLFAASGRVGIIQVIDRNPPKGLRTNSFFTREWEFIEERVKTNYKMGPAYDRPDHLHQLLEMADRISGEIQAFYRLDFYLTTRGPVFGEFTSYPSAGMAFTPYGDRLMCEIMEQSPEYD
ncbi:hypothetical protein JYP51_20010 [Ponticoccus gilvus]|nr:hypothetical protein [Enemella evansiae]